MVRKLKRKGRKLIIRIVRGSFFVFLGMITLMLILTGYLLLDRDNISKRVLLSMNNHTRGELSFESVSFNPFIQFPSMSMLIREVEFYENPIHERNQNEDPLAAIETVYAALDVRELIRGRVEVSRMLFERGEIHLIQYPDTTINLMNAIEIIEPQPGRPEEEQKDSLVMDVSTLDSSTFEIDLDYILLEDIDIYVDNLVEKNRINLTISTLRARLEYTPEAIRSNLDADIKLESLELSGNNRINNSDIYLETSLVFSRKELNLQLDPSLLIVDRAKLNIEGDVNFKGTGFVDLKFNGSDDDFTLSQLILSETGLKNLEEGDLYFRGTVRDNDLKGIPVLDLLFGINDVRLYVPMTGKHINDLNLSGRFNSGERTDLSAAWLRIDTIHAELPDGYVNGNLFARNINALEFNLNWDMKSNISGFNQIFNFSFMDSLSGMFSTSIIAEGAKYHPDSGYITVNFFEAYLNFNDASVAFPGIMSIEDLNGRIHHHDGITKFYELQALVDDSDFLINGNINNPLYILFGVDTVIRADLEIRSELFDLPGFLDFVPEVRKAFPFRIFDLDIGVQITTSTDRILQMSPNPSITFDIKHLDAEVENLLPPLSISQGIFELDHRNGRTYLDFKDFKIGIQESSLDVDLEYHSPAKRRNYLAMDIEVEGLNPAKLIWDEETDTLPEILNGLLSGSLLLDLHFPHDTIQTLKRIDLRQADLLFVNSKDTFETSSLKLMAEDIYINTEKDPNPFATLTADLEIGSVQSSFNSFSWVGYDFIADVRDGVYTIHPDKSRFFGKEGAGLYVLDPFSEQPNYKIKYHVDQYNVKDLMSNFIKDTLLIGKMDFMVDVELNTPEEGNILAGLNGQIQLKGQDLILYGIELDKLIRKFERSQTFNLVDLGAVMFLGPAGLALSKGGSYANIIVSDYSENSPVTNLISELKIKDGRIMLNDLAFSTEENRVAARGWIDPGKDSIDIIFAVVDKNGCSIIDQRLYGSVREPEKSGVRFLETIIAPVTNLLQAALGKNCEPFYEGSVPHP